jgi:hypothetical protein
MELPSDIWNLIVSESLKNNDDIINGMELNDLTLLESVIANKKEKFYEEKNKINIKIANELKIGDVFSYSLNSGAELCKQNELIENEIIYDVVYNLNDNQIVTRSFVIDGGVVFGSVRMFINKNQILNKLNYNDIPDIYNMKMKEKKMSYCLFKYKALKKYNLRL